MMSVIESSDSKDAIDRDLDEKLARINEARKIPSTVRSAAGCFARNFRPPKRAIEFSKLPEIDFRDFHSIEEIEQSFKGLNGSVETYACCDTLQVKDYSRYNMAGFDENHKKEMREKQFPNDLKEAFRMGARLSEKK